MLKINGQIVGNENYPNGETIFKDVEIVPVMTFYLKYESDKDLFALSIYAKYIGNRNEVQNMSLIMPYLPYSRMDRRIPEYVFSLRYFAMLLEELEFDAIYCEDVHSNVSKKLIPNMKESSPWNNINEALAYEYAVDYFFFPDKGAMERYSEAFNLGKSSYFHGDKVRDVNTGKILGYSLVNAPDLTGATVFIIDDLCSKGFTFYNAGMMLKEEGAERVVLYITHCENAIYDGVMLNSEYVDKIYTTGSILTNWTSSKIQRV